MKRIDWKVFVLLGIIVSVAIGFLYGTGILGGASANPGSSGDPLISQSYADANLSRAVADMDAKIATLEAKVKTLEDEIIILTGGTIEPDASTTTGGTGTGSTGSGSTGSGSTGTGSGGSGSTSATVSEANVGKSATVTGDVVNLRESATTSAAIKKKLTPSDSFTITKVDIDKGWYQVQLADGTVGWVAGYLVKIK